MVDARAIFLIAIMLAAASSGALAGDFVYDDGGRRDPFYPLVDKDGNYILPAANEASDKVGLEGIIWDDSGGSYAIINGEVLREGERRGSMKLIKINRDNVVVERGGVQSAIPLIEAAEGTSE